MLYLFFTQAKIVVKLRFTSWADHLSKNGKVRSIYVDLFAMSLIPVGR